MNGFSAADMSTAAANGHAEGYQAGYADAVKAVEVGKPAAAQEAVSPTDAVCPILARAPAEYTYWGKRVWRRGVMDSTAAQEPIGYANLHHLNDKSTDGVVLRKRNEFFTVPVYVAPVAASPVDAIKRLQEAIEGELDGLSVDCETAESILAHTFHVSPLNIKGAAEVARVIGYEFDNDGTGEGLKDLEVIVKAASTPAAPGIDLADEVESLRRQLERAKNAIATLHSSQQLRDKVAGVLDASHKSGTDAEPKIWGIQKPGNMPKLFGAHHIAELNWYPDEGYDLICMQVIERVQATSAEVGA